MAKTIKKDDLKNTNLINNDSKKKKKLSKFKFFLLFFLIFILICSIIIYKERYLFFSNESVDDLEYIKENNNDKMYAQLSNLENRIQILEEKIKSTDLLISSLEDKLDNQKIDLNKIQIIKIALNIKDKIDSQINFSNDLLILTSFLKDIKSLNESLSILNLYKNNNVTDYSTLITIFNKEFKIFCKKFNKADKYKMFSKFISFRRVENFSEFDKDSFDYFAYYLEEYIKIKDYSSAYELLNSKLGYKEYFKETYAILETNVLLINSITDIINYLVNND